MDFLSEELHELGVGVVFEMFIKCKDCQGTKGTRINKDLHSPNSP
jgi:hypothetical protein